jgi:calcineurin-like phosphoesterase family protein
MIYFIGDCHFDHFNIIKYCSRPFLTANEMNQHMLKQWNSTVTKEDTVYYLGDIVYGRDSLGPLWWWNKLNGNKILIKGNHDLNLSGIKPVHKCLTSNFNGINFVLVHSPEYLEFKTEDWVIHGHHHNNELEKYPLINRVNKTINVSAEMINYKPISLEEIIILTRSE